MSKSKPEDDQENQDRAEKIRTLKREAEVTVQKETQEIKTKREDAKTVREKTEKVHKPAAKIDSNTANNAETMENTSFDQEPLSEPLSDTSVLDAENELEKLVPLRRVQSDVSVSDLKREQERVQKVKVAQEMLEAGWSVRETAAELKLPKSLVERTSKRINSSESRPRGGYRQEYLERPYRRALSEEDNEEDLVEYARREQVRIDKMTIQRDMMRRNGLIGGDDDSDRNSSHINWTRVLEARAMSGNNNNSFDASLDKLIKLGVIRLPPQENPIDVYTKLESMKDSAIVKYQTLQAQAMQAARESANKGIVSQAIEQFAPALTNLTKSLGQVRIPSPTVAAPRMPGPMEIPNLEALQSLGRQRLGEGQILSQAQAPENLDLGLEGYSNLDAVRGKTKLEKEVR